MNDIDMMRAFGQLEQKVEHLVERTDALEATAARLADRVTELTSLLDQARGARWVIGILIGIVSFTAGVGAALKAWKP